MEQKNRNCFFLLLRSSVCARPLLEEEKAQLSTETIKEVMDLGKRYDVQHLIAFALQQNGLGEGDPLIRNTFLQAIYRYERFRSEYLKLCEYLQERKIPFLPLKGVVISDRYPEAWMRISCDVDVLVRPEDIDQTAEFLGKEKGYRLGRKDTHDISLFSPGKVHFELHYDLIEKNFARNAASVLTRVWECAVPKENSGYLYELPDEMFYFYHIAHMAKHVEYGGCGIRPLMDLWILDRTEGAENPLREKLLEEGGLLKFAQTARKLSRVWFDGEEHNEATRLMEQFIAGGGAYGSKDNQIAVQQIKKGGRFRYAWKKIFLPYNSLKLYYPFLQHRPWLYPAMQLWRWGTLIFGGKAKQSLWELKNNLTRSEKEQNEVKRFLQIIGLSNE